MGLSMPDTRMIVSALSDVGRARRTNEDAFAVTDLASGQRIEVHGADKAIDIEERGVLLALSDGMGGHQAGEVASALVLDSLQDALKAETRGAIHEQLEEAVQRANRSVMTAAQEGNRHGMGATLTAVFVRGSEAYIAEIGDSRAYLLRKGRLRQITRDQSLVQLLVDHGVLSPEEAKKSPSKNVILQAVGLAEDVRVAIARLELRRDDRFLLCSDGVSNAVSDDELKQILTGSEPRAACDTMIALANDRGGLDNQTAIVADLIGEGLDTPDEFETVTSTYEVLKAYEATVAGKPVTNMMAHAAGAAAGASEALPDLPLDMPEPGPATPPAAGEIDVPDPAATTKLPRAGAGARKMLWAVVLVVAAVVALLIALAV
jgi:PPM family protein phosphatase